MVQTVTESLMVTTSKIRKTARHSIDVYGASWKNFFAQSILFLILHLVYVTSLVRYRIVTLLCEISYFYFRTTVNIS